MSPEEIERHVGTAVMALAELESKLEANGESGGPEWAYIDAAQLALQRLLHEGGEVANTLRAKGVWRF